MLFISHYKHLNKINMEYNLVKDLNLEVGKFYKVKFNPLKGSEDLGVRELEVIHLVKAGEKMTEDLLEEYYGDYKKHVNHIIEVDRYLCKDKELGVCVVPGRCRIKIFS